MNVEAREGEKMEGKGGGWKEGAKGYGSGYLSNIVEFICPSMSWI